MVFQGVTGLKGQELGYLLDIDLKIKCNRKVDSILLKNNVAMKKVMNEAMKRRYKIQ